MKPIDAVRLCHFPLVALGVISAIYTCEQTIKQKIPNPVMARVIVNIKRLGAKPLANDAREKINMEARNVFLRPIKSEITPPAKPPRVIATK